jgi:hypothetical protein
MTKCAVLGRILLDFVLFWAENVPKRAKTAEVASPYLRLKAPHKLHILNGKPYGRRRDLPVWDAKKLIF